VRFGSLFSGIGGLDLGLEMAGMECSWMVEVDKFGSQILKHQWPEAEIYGDIYTIDGKELEPVDLICGGFPCQPVSLAGKRGGTSDERWLWGEFARIIRQVKPRWVVAENVTGLFSANSGRAFAGVLRDLAEGGYDAVWDVYPAGGPGGVGAPHRRERVFIVAHTDSSKQAKKSGDVREVSGVSQEVGEDISAVVSGRGGKDVANTNKKRLQRSKETRDVKGKGQDREEYIARCNKSAEQWAVEPNVGRVANGVPNRVDRLRALGNGVVPQVAYKVARMIYEYTEKEK